MDLKRQEVVAELEQVEPELRCVFPALCAERILPWWELVAQAGSLKDASAVRDSLASLWSYTELRSGDQLAIQRLLGRCKSLLVEDARRHNWAYVADDCIASTCYALQAMLTKSANDAAWASNRGLDSVFQFVLKQTVLKERSGPVRLNKSDYAAATSHLLYVAEVERQRQDLRDLRVMGKERAPSDLTKLRQRAQSVVPVVFGIDPSGLA